MKSILQRLGFATGSLIGLGLLIAACPARADGPEAGGYIGAGFPVGHYNDTASTGGVLGGQGGYRWNVSPNGAVSLIGGPQFTLLPSEDCPAGPLVTRCSNGSDITSTFSFTAGPKFTVVGEKAELSVAVLGGIYDDISGPIRETGGGLAVHGVLGGNIGNGFNLGVFLRFEEMFMRPSAAADSARDDRQMVLTGLTLNWTPAAEAVEQPPPPPPPPPAPAPAMKRKMILRGVNFDFDKSAIRPDARPILDEAIRTLKAEPTIRVRIEGHTDSIGSDQYNMRLSQRRADAVRQYMINGGIAASRLEAVGKGKREPVASNDTADGRAQNRRAELIVL
jgi:outer membrane protein OmpA-like peptidoglycan-associated protein